MENELRVFIRDYLNGEYKKEELALKFDLKQCEICGEYDLEESLQDTEEMVNGGCGYCCEGCIEDGDMIAL